MLFFAFWTKNFNPLPLPKTRFTVTNFQCIFFHMNSSFTKSLIDKLGTIFTKCVKAKTLIIKYIFNILLVIVTWKQNQIKSIPISSNKVSKQKYFYSLSVYVLKCLSFVHARRIWGSSFINAFVYFIHSVN
jgi:hypothetical protein